jgi:hypothetical protein
MPISCEFELCYPESRVAANGYVVPQCRLAALMTKSTPEAGLIAKAVHAQSRAEAHQSARNCVITRPGHLPTP